VVIVEFSDFQCPHCARAYRDLKRVLPRFRSDVQVVFRHFPLDKSCNPAVTASAHPYACLAAAASECAAAQGRFWEYHDVLFEHQSALGRDHLVRYADDLGLDRARFLACLDSDAPRVAVRSDVAAAEKLGIKSTPTFFLNGRVLRGALESDKFEYAIRLERAANRAGS
jgi:protein-disulfide isomerase